MKSILFAALLALGGADAETPAAPCTGFDWPMARELAAFEAAPEGPVSSGTTASVWPEGAIRLSMTPGGEKDFPVPSERPAKSGTGSGVITLPAPSAAGTYQVTLGAKAWVDVVQNGKALKSGAHTMDATCPAIRKSVRFDLVAAPVTLQISGSDATSVVFTILPAAN